MKKYITVLKIELKQTREYILNFIGQLIYLPLHLLIVFFMWKFVYASNPSIKEYTFNDIISYYFILGILQTAIMPVGIVTYEVWNSINSGGLNMYLCKPIYYPLYIFCTKVGYFFWGIIFGFSSLYVIKSFILDISIPTNLTLIVSSFVAAFLGLIIMYCLFMIIGVLTFWLKNVLTLRDNLWNIIKILSGQLLPLAFFPGFLQKISNALPFQYIYYIPISIFQMKIHAGQTAQYLVFQAIWAMALIILLVMVWNLGIKRYESQGG